MNTFIGPGAGKNATIIHDSVAIGSDIETTEPYQVVIKDLETGEVLFDRVDPELQKALHRTFRYLMVSGWLKRPEGLDPKVYACEYIDHHGERHVQATSESA